MDVDKLDDGLWRWTGEMDDGRLATSLYIETTAGVVLVDPVLPREARDTFLRALDRDVGRVGGKVSIALTHAALRPRAAELACRYHASVWFPGNDMPPDGIQVLATSRDDTVLFWIPFHSTLFTGRSAIRAVPGSPA